MKVLLIPLDGRPCNTDLPRALAAVAGAEVLLPPARLLGRYMRPADPRPILEFLRREAPRASTVVVSADMCVHGGLEMSRGGRLSKREALSRVGRLESAVRPFAGKTVIFSAITRGTITATKESELSLWRDVGAYNAAKPGSRAKKSLRRRIDPRVLSDYSYARERNHEVNKRLARLGRVRQVLFLQDDAGPHGPHIAEQRELARGGPVVFMPGTDEACSMLVCGAVVEALGLKPRLRLIPSDPAGLRRFALYEHQVFSESLRSHLSPLGIELVAKEADVDFFVNTPYRDSRDLFLEEPPKHRAAPRRFLSALASGRDAVLADCGHCNGADPGLMADVPPRLAGFAAWNTASNTLGTALAHAAMIAVGKRLACFEAEASRRLTLARLLEDWLFQSVARPEFGRRCLREGIDRFGFGAHAAALDRALDLRLHALARRLLPADLPRFRASFPWGRLFEAKIEWI